MDKDARLRKLAEEALAGLHRASDDAWKRSKETGTPFIVWRDGKVVDLNAHPEKYKPDLANPGAVVREEPEED